MLNHILSDCTCISQNVKNFQKYTLCWYCLVESGVQFDNVVGYLHSFFVEPLPGHASSFTFNQRSFFTFNPCLSGQKSFFSRLDSFFSRLGSFLSRLKSFNSFMSKLVLAPSVSVSSEIENGWVALGRNYNEILLVRTAIWNKFLWKAYFGLLSHLRKEL